MKKKIINFPSNRRVKPRWFLRFKNYWALKLWQFDFKAFLAWGAVLALVALIAALSFAEKGL